MPYKTYTDASGERKSSYYPGQWVDRTPEQIAESTGQSQDSFDYGDDVPDSERTFWENPKKIVEWHTMIQAGKSDPNMKVPDAVPSAQIEEAYNYLSIVNKDVPVEEWKPPKANDPLRSYLKQIPQIPPELMPPADRAEYESKMASINQTADSSMQPIKEVGDYNKLELDRQLALMFLDASANPEISNRPGWTRGPATFVQGVMGGLGPGLMVGAVATPIAGAAAFLAFGGVAAYMAATGERIPGISDIYDKFQIPAKALESGIGQLSLDMTPQERVNAILPNMANVVTQLAGGKENAAMAAGRLKYETSKPIVMDTMIWAMDSAYNLAVPVAGLFGAGWKKQQIDQAGEGYRWDINKGINDPVKIQGSIEDAALNEYWNKLKVASPANFDKVLQEIEQDSYDRFGYSGVLNDLVGQTILDPLNFAPFVEGIGAEKFAKIMKRAGVAPEMMDKFAGVAGRQRGNPMIDILPIGVQQIAEAIVRGKGDKPDFKPFGMDIGAFGKRSASGGLIGTIEAYKREVRGGTYFGKETPATAADLSPSSKRIAGLAPDGTFKELKPVEHLPISGVSSWERTKNTWINNWRDLTSLTPESKAFFYLDTFKDNAQVIAKEFSNSPSEVVRNIELLSRAGDADRVQQTVDAVDRSVSNKDALFNSPTAATTADGLKYAIEKTGNMLGIYDLTGNARKTIADLSAVIKETPASIIQKMKADPEAYFKEISLKPGVKEFLTKSLINNGDDLKTRFDVFSGKDAVALNDNEFTAKYINALTDAMGEYLVKKYDVKPQNKTLQVFGLMKDVQSLLVLGLNPGYYINNMLNNIVTRAAQGVFGFMPLEAETRYWARKGYSPTRLNTGVGASGEGTEVGGMDAISRAALDKGKISDIRRSVKDIARKIGLFQKLSQQVEIRESGLAFTIGEQIMHRKLWKMDVGIDRLPANVEKFLQENHPGFLERLYSGVESSLNMDEVRAVMGAEYIQPQVKDVFNKILDEIYTDPENPQRTEPIRDMFAWIGFENDLQEKLSKARTPEDVDKAIADVKSKIQENIDEKQLDSLHTAASEIPNMMQAEGTIASVKIYTDLEEYLTKRYLDHFKAVSDRLDILRDATFEQRTKILKDLNDQEAKKFIQDHAKEVATLKGLADGMGMESPEFINKIGELNKLSEAFFENRNRRYNEVFDNAVPGPEWDKKYAALQAEQDTNYAEYNQIRTRLLTEKDNIFFAEVAKRNSDPVLRQVIQEWRSKVMELEVKRQGMMDSVRKELTAKDATGVYRGKIWDDFHKKYDPLVMQISTMNIDYANQVAAVYKRGETIFAEQHWTASTPENSTGWNPNKIETNPSYTPETLKSTADFLSGKDDQFIKTYLDLETETDRNALLDSIKPEIASRIKTIFAIEQAQGSEQVIAEAISNARSIANSHKANIEQAEKINYSASVPVMITNAMKEQLRAVGVTPGEIRHMTPQQAWDKINSITEADIEQPPIISTATDFTPGKPDTIKGIIELARISDQKVNINADGTISAGTEKHIVATVNLYTPSIQSKVQPPYKNIGEIPLDIAELAYVSRRALKQTGLRFENHPEGIEGHPNSTAIIYHKGEPIAYAFPNTSIKYDSSGNQYQLLGYNDEGKLVIYFPLDDVIVYHDMVVAQEQNNPVIGTTPPGKLTGAIDHAKVNEEINATYLEGALTHFGERFKQELQMQVRGVGRLDPETLAQIKAWQNGLQTQMASANLASQRHGEMMRDGALLNYSWRYGADNWLTAIFPYQFWYTRTMMQWGKRMIDRPAWFAMYARLKETQERTASKGIPARFAGKLRFYAPWLPEWAGTNLFSDPLSQVFPLEIYTNLGETMQYQISSIDRETQQNLLDMVDNAQITREQYDAALLDKTDPLYVTAYEDARKKSDMYNPVSLASMMMQPSMWIMDANYIASGTPEKISVLPITKTSRAVGTALQDTPLEFMGNLIEMLGSGPEVAIRKSAGLSPYGTWGDYYIDRELANLVADGKYSATDAMIAMIDRKGEAFVEAENRVRTQDMYKVPLATVLQSIAKTLGGTGDPKSIAPTLISSAMPFSVLPEGEMIQRGLAVEYKKAWDMMKAGDLKAINNFFAEHPEYQARLAINKEPDERLKQLLINQIWEKYNLIPSANKRMVSEGLGSKFQTNFLNTATHDYETIDIPTLAFWAQALGGQVPDKAGKVPQYQMPKIETYTPAMTKAITDYKNEKNKLFPMVDLQQQMYFDKGSDKSVLASFPQIKKYWDWKKQYEAKHPELKPYFDANREIAKEKPTVETVPFDPGNFALTTEEMKLFSPTLVKLVVSNIKANQPLGEGAIASLRVIWEKLGKPDGTLQKWYDNKVKATFEK